MDNKQYEVLSSYMHCTRSVLMCKGGGTVAVCVEDNKRYWKYFYYSPLALLERLALALGPMAETQLDQTMHKVPFI